MYFREIRFPQFCTSTLYIYMFFFISIEMSCHNICYEKYHNVKPMSMSVLIMICSREVRLGRPSGCSYIIYIYIRKPRWHQLAAPVEVRGRNFSKAGNSFRFAFADTHFFYQQNHKVKC